MRQFAPAAVIALGFLLDQILGDPQAAWHPVRLIGQLITGAEAIFRGLLGKSEKSLLAAGFCMMLTVCACVFGTAWILLLAANTVSSVLGFSVSVLLCWLLLAAKSLKSESMKVYDALEKGDVEGARAAVSMIVGRDTKSLTAAGIAKAAVETVAENTSDGVIAPLFYMALGGPALGWLYKAVNTMDSMVGYKNDKYLYFGRAAAKLDDILNLIPARISALLMVLSAYLLGMNGKNAWKIFLRDRYRHASPNSAQTEAACAGALGLELAGDAYYFGKLYKKETIGDNLRPVEAEDIKRANRLMTVTSVLFAGIVILIGIGVRSVLA